MWGHGHDQPLRLLSQHRQRVGRCRRSQQVVRRRAHGTRQPVHEVEPRSRPALALQDVAGRDVGLPRQFGLCHVP